MTTYDTAPSLREFAVMRLSLWARKRANKAQGSLASTHVTAVLNTLVRVVMHLAGFALLTLAAFQWNMIAGLAAAGISCFAFSTLMTGSTVDERGGGTAPDMRTGR